MEEFISQQLFLIQQDRNKLKEKIDKYDDKIQKSISRIGIKPKENEDQLVIMLSRLEFNHTTTSQSNADERKFMQERDKILVKQKHLIEYTEAQLELDKLKIALSAARIEMREKDRCIDDLKANQRRVIIANKLKCSMDDIIEQRLTIPAEKIPQIIGKKGANLKKIEDDTTASIKADRNGGGLTIVGTPNSINDAIAIIMSVVNSAIEDISPSEEAITCLLFNKATLVDDIQGKCNVRIDISKAQKLCKVSGTLDCIAAAKREIEKIDCSKNIITITPTMLPFILGKGGSTIRGLGEGKVVQIDISKESNFITILGLKTHVESVTATLYDIISENKEVEEIIHMPKYILLGACSGSNNARNLAKEYGASILLDDKKECITIRGVTSKVLQAKFYLNSLLSNYQKTSVSLDVNEQYLAWIVGKGGKNINDLRKKYPGANIDIIDTTIHINTTSAETRKEIVDYINSVIDSKYSKEIPFDSELSVTLKSQKGAVIRKKMMEELKLILDIDTNNQVVKLRGLKANVDVAIAELEEFRKKYHCEVLSINDGDFIVLQEKGSDSLVKKMELDFSVEINVNRKDGIVRVRGEKDAVDKAKSAIIGILEGDSNHGSSLINVLPSTLSALIGKNGQTMKKMEKEHNVKIDVLRSENKIRLRGPPESISMAADAITKFIDEVKVTSTIIIESYTKNFDTSGIVDEVALLYDIEAIGKDNEIIIKGSSYVVEEAKKFIQNKTANSIEFTVNLKSHQLQALKAVNCDRALRGISDRHNISISINDMSLVLSVKGTGINVHKAKAEIMKILNSTFPTEFLIIEFEMHCLKEIASPKEIIAIEEASGANILVERSHGCLFIMGLTNSVINAAQMVKDSKKHWEKLHAFFGIEEYMLPSIVGKQGASIIALQKETEATITVNRKAMQLEVKATSSEKISKAKILIQNKIDKLRKEHWEYEVPSSLLKLFIGKQGVNINKLRTESGASIEIVDKSNTVKVTGDESSVSLAKIMIKKFVGAEAEKNFHIDLAIPQEAIGLIVGAKGARIKEIHDDSGANIEIDKVKNVLNIKGTPDACKKAEEIVNQLLTEAGYNREPEVVEEEVVEEVDNDAINSNEDAIVYGKFGRLPPGATPEMIAKMQEQSMSKSALRRKRRKEKECKEAAKDFDEDAADFDYDDVYTAPKDDSSFKNAYVGVRSTTPLEILKEESVSRNPLSIFSSSSIIKPGPIVTNFNFEGNMIDNNASTSANTSPKNGVGIIGSARSSSTSTLTTSNNIIGSMTNNMAPVTYGNTMGISSILALNSSNDTNFPTSPPGLPQPSFHSNYNNPTLSMPFNTFTNDTKPTTETIADGYFKSKSGFSIRM